MVAGRERSGRRQGTDPASSTSYRTCASQVYPTKVISYLKKSLQVQLYIADSKFSNLKWGRAKKGTVLLCAGGESSWPDMGAETMAVGSEVFCKSHIQ